MNQGEFDFDPKPVTGRSAEDARYQEALRRGSYYDPNAKIRQRHQRAARYRASAERGRIFSRGTGVEFNNPNYSVDQVGSPRKSGPVYNHPVRQNVSAASSSLGLAEKPDIRPKTNFSDILPRRTDAATAFSNPSFNPERNFQTSMFNKSIDKIDSMSSSPQLPGMAREQAASNFNSIDRSLGSIRNISVANAKGSILNSALDSKLENQAASELSGILNDPNAAGFGAKGPRGVRDSAVGRAYSKLFPKSWNERQNRIQNSNKQKLVKNIGASILNDNPVAMASAKADYGAAIRSGGSKFRYNMATAFQSEINKSFRPSMKTVDNLLFRGKELSGAQSLARSRIAEGFTSRAMQGPIQKANQITRGSSLMKAGGFALPKMMGGIALAGAAAMGVGAAMGYSPGQTASGISSGVDMAGQMMQQAGRPTYGSSSLGQSVQGLTFGLHSRRTA